MTVTFFAITLLAKPLKTGLREMLILPFPPIQWTSRAGKWERYEMNETTSQAHRKYDQEFMLAELEHLHASGNPQRAVAEEPGINVKNPRDRIAAFAARPPAPSGARPRTSAERAT